MKGDRALTSELEVFEKLMTALDSGIPARAAELDKKESELLADIPLLTMKPVIYVANVSEDDTGAEPLGNPHYIRLKKHADAEGSGIVAVCAQIEADLAVLEADERALFLSELGVEESGLDRLIHTAFRRLGLATFLTAGPKESRAWT